jgi:hypothetical protein
MVQGFGFSMKIRGFTETPALFVALPVTLMSGVPVGGGLVCRCISRQLVCGDVFKVLACRRQP